MITPVQAHILGIINDGAGPPRGHVTARSRLSDARVRLIIRNLRKRGLLSLDDKGLSPSGKQLLKRDQKMRENLIGTEIFFMRYALSKGPMWVTVQGYDHWYVQIKHRKEDTGRRSRELCVKWSELALTEKEAFTRTLQWARKKEKALRSKLECLETIISDAEFTLKMGGIEENHD